MKDPELTKEWHRELKVMSGRIGLMRQTLYDLIKKDSKQNWDHIINQIGMFAYTGFTKEQVGVLKKEKHIFLTDDGRISVAGLNTKNVNYVAKCFAELAEKSKH